MDGQRLEQIERQLAGIELSGAPRELRAAVLVGVDRELRASRWDRRLARTAVALFLVGVSLNAAIGLRPVGSARSQLAAGSTSESLVPVAMGLAEATDAQTALRFTRHLAALAGRQLSGDEVAAIDAALEKLPDEATNRGDG